MSATSGRRTAADVITELAAIAEEWALTGRDDAAGALEQALEELDRRIEKGLA